mgnify:CR=1 FL=1
MYYEDACLFLYIKSLLVGFNTNHVIKEVVIDEAQDYNKLQYLIIKRTFKTADYTILGDTNQTINPYYKYDSLEEIRIRVDKPIILKFNNSEKIIRYNIKLKLRNSRRFRIYEAWYGGTSKCWQVNSF